ncbi:ATG4B-like protein [Mya arenaria]|uniref:Cysteine protease n=1 Tax=Mya arenaria TaxID=6604 RepID=A0ABY7G3R6_MYAAR|nr:ATG4B-like protein [Mya arenaria]
MALFCDPIPDVTLTYECGPIGYDDFPKTEDPVFLLGEQYSALYDLEEIRDDVKSRLWLTYRKGFPSIGGTGPTSDQGWGCMLRCGQMMLAQTLLVRHLGRASMGVSEGKSVGQWFGPNTVAQVLNLQRESEYIQHTDKVSTPASPARGGAEVNPKIWKPLLLIIPLRLGLTDTNVVYVESLKKCLNLKQSVGMIGGKPNHAHWFVGYVGEELVYLDPHTTQPVVDVTEPGSTDESYHCQYASRMKILELDPSIALGFYCGTEADFDDLCSSLQKFVTCRRTSAMFELHKERPLHWPPYEPYTTGPPPNTREYDLVEKSACDSDDGFELVG